MCVWVLRECYIWTNNHVQWMSQIKTINNNNKLSMSCRLPYDLMSCVVYKLQCGRCNASCYGETDRHLKVRSGEHIGIFSLNFKKVKPSAKNSIRNHFLFCNHDLSFDDFTIVAQGTNKFLLGIKESLLIMRDKPRLEKTSVLLHYSYLARYNMIG